MIWYIWYDGYAWTPGKDIKDPRVLSDCGDLPVQEIRDVGVTDERLMQVVSESVCLVMEHVSSIVSLSVSIDQFKWFSIYFLWIRSAIQVL